ncbi:MAG: tRNA dimethylallyltransferase, partial [Nocardioidaceae bacterium]|nr:tRNA dimethylallyltransferase [Nocardioidaceae bacterium]
GLAEGRTARSAIGYREVTSYLEGRTTLDQAIEATAAATRRFSRRQDGWFRKDPRVVWVPWDAPDRVERALAAVARAG